MKALAGKLCLIICGSDTGKQVRALRLYEGHDIQSANGSPLWWCEPISKDMNIVVAGTRTPWVGPVEKLLCTEKILMPIDPDETLENETIGEDQNARV